VGARYALETASVQLRRRAANTVKSKNENILLTPPRWPPFNTESEMCRYSTHAVVPWCLVNPLTKTP
jgi:hypothetical protein